MIWRWLICSSAAAALAVPVLGATLTGRVQLLDSKVAQVRKKNDYSGVVIWLEPVERGTATRIAARSVKMIQKDKTFTPHVLPVTVGSTVEFPNFDPIFHNAFSNYNGQIFDVGLYPPGATRAVRFTRPGVVRVFCNIHANMSAVIVVLNTPHYASSGTTGDFEIANLPPGEYQMRVFHERATDTTLRAFSRRITIERDNVTLPPLVISEGGYLAIPHKNKYGKPYPPAPDETGAYPATGR